jgi:hypothetical protein
MGSYQEGQDRVKVLYVTGLDAPLVRMALSSSLDNEP